MEAKYEITKGKYCCAKGKTTSFYIKVMKEIYINKDY